MQYFDNDPKKDRDQDGRSEGSIHEDNSTPGDTFEKGHRGTTLERIPDIQDTWPLPKNDDNNSTDSQDRSSNWGSSSNE